MHTILIFAALLFQDPAPAPASVPTKEDAAEALKEFRTALKAGGEASRIDAAKEALGTPHSDVIKTVAKLLKKDTERVRIAIAIALGEIEIGRASL